jgi:hypothetical protein
VPGGGVWHRWTRGDARALPCREAGSGSMGHVVMPEPSRDMRWGLVAWDTWGCQSPPVPGGAVWRHGTCGDARALPRREVRFGTVGLDLGLVRRGTRSVWYQQWPPGPPRERQGTYRWRQYLFPHVAFTIFSLVGFDVAVLFHQRTHGDIRSTWKHRGV